jgi:hypothetical protein
VAVLTAIFVVGCSKSSVSTQIPHISFVGYADFVAGQKLAYFTAKNPTQYLIVCKVQAETGDESKAQVISIPARGSAGFAVIVRTNTEPNLSVKVVRLVTVHEFTVPMPNRFTVPMPNTDLEPTATAPSIFDATLTLDSQTNIAEPAAFRNLTALYIAERSYTEDHHSRGQVLPSSVTLQDLATNGYISAQDIRAFEGMEVTIYPTAGEMTPPTPQAILIHVRMSDGVELAVLADGSIRQLPK